MHACTPEPALLANRERPAAAPSTLPRRDIGPIVVVTPWFPNRPGERNGNFVYDSAAALARRATAVHVLVCRPWAPGIAGLAPEWMRGRLDPASFGEFASLSIARYVAIPRARGRLRAVADAWRDRQVAPALRRLARGAGAMVIHAQTEGFAGVAGQIAREVGCAAVATIHGINTDPSYRTSLRTRLHRALNSVDRLILVGEPLRPFVCDLGGGDVPFCVVPNGVALPADMAPTAILEEHTPLRLISVANLHEGKGIDVVLRALALLRERGLTGWAYTVVGDGSERASLEQLANSLGLDDQVRFLSAQPHSRIYALLGGADVFVLPSYREAFGIAYLEAMAAGLATIGVRGQGPAAFIEHGKTGFLVEPRDARSLADCIAAINGDRQAARHIAATGSRAIRARFTWDAHAAQLTSVYGEAVADARRDPRRRVLMLYIEPAPYILGLVEEVRAIWQEGIEVAFVAPPSTQPWRYESNRPDEAILPRALPAACAELARRLASGRYALVHLAGWGHPLMLAALLLGAVFSVPVTVESDSQLLADVPRWKRLLKAVLYPPLFGLPAVFLPGGTRQARYLRHYGVDERRIRIAQMTGDVAAIADYADGFNAAARAEARRRRGVPEHAVVVLYVGRLEPHKGITELLRAFRLLYQSREDIVLLVAGTGSLEGVVRQCAAQNNAVRYLGHLVGAELREAYAIADMLVLPSLFEPWGLVVNEAMASGLPVVATDRVGCADDLIDDETGMLVTSGAAEPLSRAIAMLARNSEMRRRMGSAARRRIDGWTLRNWAELTVAGWRQALARPLE